MIVDFMRDQAYMKGIFAHNPLPRLCKHWLNNEHMLWQNGKNLEGTYGQVYIITLQSKCGMQGV